jgi:hypothetical protein
MSIPSVQLAAGPQTFRIILFCQDKERAQTEATCIKNTGGE